MAAAVTDLLPLVVVLLPFASAVALALIASWRIGSWLNAGCASLLVVAACLLPWHLDASIPLLHVSVPETCLAMLTSLIAMTTGWFSHRELPALLAARSLDRRRVRLYHAAFQGLLGAILLALLSDNLVLTWLALAIAICAAAAVTGTVRTQAAGAAASHLLLLCGVGLMLALLGTLLLYVAAESHAAALRWSTLQSTPYHAPVLHLACIFLVLGYGALAGAVPLQGWLLPAAAEGVAPGSIIVSAVLPSAPLLLFIRLRAAMGPDPELPAAILMTFGLATLLLGAGGLLAQTDARRTLACAGMAQIGLVMVAIGIGGPAGTFAAWLIITLLALARTSALQCVGLPATRLAAWTRFVAILALALLPLFAMFLIAGTTVWLLLPLGCGVLLTCWGLLSRLPIFASLAAAPPRNAPFEVAALSPIWLQLALLVVLALAMPGPVVDWFNAMAAAK